MRTDPPRIDDLARWWDEFRLAAGFLTRLPLGSAGAEAARPLAEASWAFPLVGLVIGLIGGFVYALAAWLGVPPLPAALLALAATALATGALHEDGLADVADGFGGGADAAEKLAIMRDSRSGAFGVLALVFSVGLRAAALAALGDGGRVTAVLVAAHALSRGLLPLVLRALEPARRDGLGAAAGRPEAANAWAAAGLGALIVLFGLDLGRGIVAVAAAALAAGLIAHVARRQIGGYTGDVLGAIEQGGEIIVMLAAVAWAS
jgi:adenosylcobinamide-GDP ribazoletransferase